MEQNENFVKVRHLRKSLPQCNRDQTGERERNQICGHTHPILLIVAAIARRSTPEPANKRLDCFVTLLLAMSDQMCGMIAGERSFRARTLIPQREGPRAGGLHATPRAGAFARTG